MPPCPDCPIADCSSPVGNAYLSVTAKQRRKAQQGLKYDTGERTDRQCCTCIPDLSDKPCSKASLQQSSRRCSRQKELPRGSLRAAPPTQRPVPAAHAEPRSRCEPREGRREPSGGRAGREGPRLAAAPRGPLLRSREKRRPSAPSAPAAVRGNGARHWGRYLRYTAPGRDAPHAVVVHHFTVRLLESGEVLSSSRPLLLRCRVGPLCPEGARAPPRPAHSPQLRRGPATAGRAAAAAPGAVGSPCPPSCCSRGVPRSSAPHQNSAPGPPAAFGPGAAASHPPRRSRLPGVGTGTELAGAGPFGPPLSPLLPPPPPRVSCLGHCWQPSSVRPERAQRERGARGFPSWN